MQAEMVVTNVLIAIPYLNIFFIKEIGMDFAQVGMSQAVCAIIFVVANVPIGWLADRFSRKVCNVIGDAGVVVVLVYYSGVDSFAEVVLAELLYGLAVSFSNGADAGLLKAYCERLKKPYHQANATVSTWRPIMEIVGVSFGSLIGATNPRLVILLSAGPFLVGALLSLSLVEVGERRESDQPPLADIWEIVTDSLRHNKQLAWSIATAVISRESTHPLVWLLTPMLVIAGVPEALLGLAWAIYLAVSSVAALIARRYAGQKMPDWQKIAIAGGAFVLSAAVLTVDINSITVLMYAGFGFVRGWNSAILPPMVQHYAGNDVQATVMSLAASMSQLLYVPLIWGVGALSDISLQAGVAGTLVLFAPLFVLLTWKHYRA